MPYKKPEIKKIYYTIGEIAEMFEVNTSLVRYWEQEFDILKPKKNKKGNRLFTEQDVDNLFLIYHLVKEKGFTLQGAKDQLKTRNKEVRKEAEMARTLLDTKAFLLQLKKELSR